MERLGYLIFFLSSTGFGLILGRAAEKIIGSDYLYIETELIGLVFGGCFYLFTVNTHKAVMGLLEESRKSEEK